MGDDIVAQIGIELSWIEQHGTEALNDLDHAALLVALRDEIVRLREQIEELETRVSTLDIAVNHWMGMYRNLDLLYSQMAGRS